MGTIPYHTHPLPVILHCTCTVMSPSIVYDSVGNLTVQDISVGKLPGPSVGTLQDPNISEVCRKIAYASPCPLYKYMVQGNYTFKTKNWGLGGPE